MSLLDFARGPALEWAAIVFVVGMLWRIGGLTLMLRNRVLSKDRTPEPWKGGLRTMFTRFSPAPVFRRKVAFQYIAGWVWHLGFVLVVFFFQLHIQFFKGIVGFGWPALPNGMIVALGAVSLAVLITLLIRRVLNPVLRMISSFDDYASTVITALPFATGLMAFAHIGLAYETMLALHFLSVALLLVWFPFSKLFHVFTVLPSRYALGVKFWRKGVKV